ncbi:ATP-dependent RNA helicase [Purpureocillium lavendulum]|uniref:ATP-dependent RNA helicase n=1 Tax=Purpureocillium lavendulum TaxID=1247861 RepID=A0AB34FZI5_9HYPO|nr:ATP-dependent RNA helicase [Purpureocillium lavendulum]
MLYSRVQTLLQRRRKQKRVALEISAPFDLKLEPVCLPGVSEDEISILREKAAASRIGIFEYMPSRSRSPSLHKISRPLRTPPAVMTSLQPHVVVPARPVW